MALRIENAFGAKMDALLKMKTAYDRGADRDGEVDIKIERYVGQPCTGRPFHYSC
jgi:plasmid maintenance system antidote protein VapI